MKIIAALAQAEAARARPLAGDLGAFEVGDDFGKILVKAGVRAGDILEPSPDLLPDNV